MYLRQPSVMIHLSQLKESCHNNPSHTHIRRPNNKEQRTKEHLNQQHNVQLDARIFCAFVYLFCIFGDTILVFRSSLEYVSPDYHHYYDYVMTIESVLRWRIFVFWFFVGRTLFLIFSRRCQNVTQNSCSLPSSQAHAHRHQRHLHHRQLRANLIFSVCVFFVEY